MKYPLINLRDSVLLPETTFPMMLGRGFSMLAVRSALKDYDGQLVVVTQRDCAQTEAPTLAQMYERGTLCKIQKHIEFPDHTMKILFRGEAVVDVLDLDSCDGLRLVEIKKPRRAASAAWNFSEPERSRWRELTSRWNPDTQARTELLEAKGDEEFLNRLWRLVALPRRAMPSKAESLAAEKEGQFMDQIMSPERMRLLNEGVRMRVEMLNIRDAESWRQRLTEILEGEIANS